jgi:hypothetical protein
VVMGEHIAIHTGEVFVLLRPARHDSAPIVLLYHGFGPPNSPQDMAQAFPLDTVEANLAYVGLPLFGERSPPGGLDEVMDRQARDYLRNCSSRSSTRPPTNCPPSSPRSLSGPARRLITWHCWAFRPVA